MDTEAYYSIAVQYGRTNTISVADTVTFNTRMLFYDVQSEMPFFQKSRQNIYIIRKSACQLRVKTIVSP